MAALYVCYLELTPLDPDEVADAVDRGKQVARLNDDGLVLLAQVTVCGVQSRAVKLVAQARVVVVGALEVAVG